MFSLFNLFYVKVREDEKKWRKEKVADAIASAVIHQNYCDWKHNPILVADNATFRFLKRKYRILTTFRSSKIIDWASGYKLLKLHPMTPAMLTPENAHIPNVYYVDSKLYEERIKPYLKEESEIY